MNYQWTEIQENSRDMFKTFIRTKSDKKKTFKGTIETVIEEIRPTELTKLSLIALHSHRQISTLRSNLRRS